jgi:hypothetical protein
MRGKHQRTLQLEQLETRAVLTTYNVGPGQAYTTVGAVPWASLQPGDVVNIHWQPTPYHEKTILSVNGTASQHIQINGIAGPQGQLPVLDGANATSSPNSPTFSYTPLEDLGLIVIYHSAAKGFGYVPGYIDINNLQLQGAADGNSYTGYAGDARSYGAGAAGVWMEGVSHVTIHGCTITNNDNGVFAKSGGGPETDSVAITLDSNYLYGNGVANNYLYHDSYIEANGALYQYNRYGPLRAGAPGNALKDRSAGVVVRYNYIQDGGHLLDLCDPQDGYATLSQDPGYLQTYVYGNVLVSDPSGPEFLVHYGDGGGVGNYRPGGVLYFYDNTVVSQDDRSDRWRTILFELEVNQETVDARDNVLYNTSATPGATPTNFELMDTAGVANFGVNWITPGWLPSYDGQTFTGTINGTSNFVTDPNNNPGFANLSSYDVHLTAGSGAIGQGGPLAAAAAASNPVTMQYVYHQGGQARTSTADLGALQYGNSVNPPPTQSDTLSVSAAASGTTAGTALTVTVQALNASGAVDTGYGGRCISPARTGRRCCRPTPRSGRRTTASRPSR